MTEGHPEIWQFYDAVNGIEMALLSGDRGHQGITFKEVIYLNAIRCGHDTVTKLSERLGVSRAAATKMADRMCAERLLVRVQDPADGRIVRLVMPENIARQYTAESMGFEDLARYMEREYGSEKAGEFWKMLQDASYHLKEFSKRITLI